MIAALNSMQTIIAAVSSLKHVAFFGIMWDEIHGQHAEHQRGGSFRAESAEVLMEPWFGRFSGNVFTKASSLRRNAVGKFPSPESGSCRWWHIDK